MDKESISSKNIEKSVARKKPISMGFL